MATVVRAYRYTGAVQTFTVPTGVTLVRMECWGAAGGAWLSTARTTPQHNDELTLASYHDAGGPPTAFAHSDLGTQAGGYTAGDRTTTPGETYSLYVGGNGQNGYNGQTQYTAAGGWNGGGTGGAGHNFNTLWPIGGGGGGGATDIRSGGTALANRIMVAGGAGGAGGASLNYGAYAPGLPTPTWNALGTSPVPPFGSATYAQAASVGYEHFQQWYIFGNAYGVGGSAGGAGAAGWWSGANGAANGKGGGSAAGGAAGTAHSGGGTAGTAGTLGQGGNGGAGSATAATTFSAPAQGGGGGGGGLYGGGGGASGGGANGFFPAGGAGGGSNAIPGTFANIVIYSYVRPPHPSALVLDGALPNGASNTTPGGLIRLTYDVLPIATIISPAAGGVVASNRATVVTVEWTSPDGTNANGDLVAGCAGADLRWSVAGANTWTQVHIDTPPGDLGSVVDLTTSIASGTFTSGTSYDIQARAYDTSGDVGNWAGITVKALPVPSAPAITAPSAGANAVTPFSLTWTNPNSLPGGNEVLYRVLLQGTNHTVDSGILNSGVRVNYSANPDAKTTGNYLLNGTNGGTLAVDNTVTDPWGNTGVLKVTWGASGAQSDANVLLPGYQFPAGTRVVMALYVKSGDALAPAVHLQWASPAVVGASVAATTSWQQIIISFDSSGADGTALLFADTLPTAGKITYISSHIIEARPPGSTTLAGPFFGKTIKDPALSSTLNTSSAGFAYITGTGAAQTLSYTIDKNVWPFGPDAVTASVQMATVDSQVFFSDYASRAFVINVSPPGAPTVTVSQDDAAGTVTLNIAVVDTPNSTSYVDVYRQVASDPTTKIRIGTQLAPDATRHVTFVDRTLPSGIQYQYFVTSYSAAGGFATTG